MGEFGKFIINSAYFSYYIRREELLREEVLKQIYKNRIERSLLKDWFYV